MVTASRHAKPAYLQRIYQKGLIKIVYVINQDGKPLMPCKPAIARLLLKTNKAKCIKRTPFTIKLLYQAKEYTQSITLGIDTGSKTVGSAAVSGSDVLYMSEIQLREDIKGKMERRRAYRRARRYRKTRYREARFENRKNSTKENRFTPTLVSKLDSHLKEITFAKSILPITKVIIETGTFDPHALKNPKVLKNKKLYQKGINYGFANTKAYVLHRDNYKCQHCKGTSGVKRLEVHHILPKSKGGSDDEVNLITLCRKCHKALHKGKIKLKSNGKRKGQLNHATQMNIIRSQLLKRLPEAIETFGFITKEHRQLAGLPSEHYYDAVAIALQGKKPVFKTDALLHKKCVAKGDYQQTKGVRSEKAVPTGKIQGFRKFDKVRYMGKEYFIKGRMSTGYAVLMDIFGKKISFSDAPKGFKTPKLANCKRIGARRSWLMQEEHIQRAI